MGLSILKDIIILLAFSVGVVFILQRFKIPSILGFLITGVIIGPFGLGLIYAVHEIEIIAEIGVILLLFVIGMELSLKQLVTMRKTVLVGGFVQVGVSVLLAMVIYRFLELRDEKMINTIRPNDTLSQNDIVYISGNVEDIEHFYNAVS